MSLFSFISNMFGSKPQSAPEPTSVTTPVPQPESAPQPAPAPTVVETITQPVTVAIPNSSLGINMYALNLIKHYEGCKLVAYQDIVGVWTIGYGETEDVHPGMVITQDQADAMIQADYIRYQARVQALIKVPVTSNQLGALTSFAYNLGVTALAGSTLLKLLNSGSPAAVVAQQFARWNMAGGKVVAGLTARRAAEAQLFLTA